MGSTLQRYWDSRTASSRAARPGDPAPNLFDAYVPHFIRHWEPHFSADTWRHLAEATERCRALSQAGADHALPAEWLLRRAESIASSTIEEIRPSARRVARAEAQLTLFGEAPPAPEMEALRNVAITKHACDLAASGRDLTVERLCDLHATLMGEDPIAGQLRDRQNWVGGGALGGPLRARHVGPPAELVPGLLDDLIAYVNLGGASAIMRAAVAHAQFETIHPFPDGNGRTGRALIQYMYLREGLITNGTLPVSSALMLAKAEYFDALDAARVVCGPDDAERSHAVRPWIDLLATATEHACRLRERLNAHVEHLQQRWAQQAQAHGIRLSSAAGKLLERLPHAPVITADSVRQLLDTNERTARHAVARLATAGVLVQRSAGRRNRVFECPDMMDAFTESVRQQPADMLTLEAPASDSHAREAK